MSAGDQFQLLDVALEEGSRIIVFFTDSCLKYLCSIKIWYGDGTFSIAPQHFYQLYTIHGIVLGQLVIKQCSHFWSNLGRILDRFR